MATASSLQLGRQIRWSNAPSKGLARPADGKVHLRSHLDPNCPTPNLGFLDSWILTQYCVDSWKGPGKEATARLIRPPLFAGAAEQVGRTGRKLLQAGWLTLPHGASRQVLVHRRLPRRACLWLSLLGTILEWETQHNALLQQLIPFAECGWQIRPLRPRCPLPLHSLCHSRLLASGPAGV